MKTRSFKCFGEETTSSSRTRDRVRVIRVVWVIFRINSINIGIVIEHICSCTTTIVSIVTTTITTITITTTISIISTMLLLLLSLILMFGSCVFHFLIVTRPMLAVSIAIQMRLKSNRPCTTTTTITTIRHSILTTTTRPNTRVISSSSSIITSTIAIHQLSISFIFFFI